MMRHHEKSFDQIKLKKKMLKIDRKMKNEI